MNAKNKNIEDIYPLSPMQQGILFHSISASDLYVQQEGFELKGNLNVEAFKQAWQNAIARHEILRTAFVWENVAQPIQIVGKQVRFPFTSYDWRDIPVEKRQQQLEEFLESDRKQALKLSQAPLMRLNLIRVDKNTHYFIWSHHHLILDGWSLSLLMEEVFTFYEKLNSDRFLPLKSPRPYRDYITWLQQQDKQEARQFWQQYLKGLTASTPFGIDRLPEDADTQGGNYAEGQIQITTVTKNKLQILASQNKITLNILLQGVWALLLSCYSGEKDVVFGSTSSGRPPSLIGAESTLGVFINTLPMRVKIEPEKLVIPWLQQLQSQQIESLQYEYMPLMEIQKESEIVKGSPLFESIFVSQDYNVGSALTDDIDDLQIRNLSFADSETNYPLTILVEARSELNIIIGYDSQRFTAKAIEQLLQHLQNLLIEIANKPHRQLKTLPILTAAEKNQLLFEWNETQVKYPVDRCIHHLFEARVTETPNAIAVIYQNQQLTYQELNDKANQLAHYLQTLSVTPETIVGICVERSVEMVVGLLGILKAGGAYVPLNPSHPVERLAGMLSDAGVSILITQQHLTESFTESQVNLVCLDSDWESIALQNEQNPISEVTINNLAYVIYTSGSTGKPKGVMVEHSSLVNSFFAWQDAYELDSVKTHLQMANFAFDVFTGDLVRALCSGGKLVLCPRDFLLEAEQLHALIQQHKIDCGEFVPAVLRNLVQYLERTNRLLDMSLVICGSDSWYVREYKQFQQFLANKTRLINSFGVTEATIDSCYFARETGELLSEQLVPIGKPFANTQLYILDSSLQPVPIGVPGELYIGGAGVARGYINRSELTQEKFIPDPFQDRSEAKLYKTGDRACYLPDGNIEFLGRIDYQVKIRGFRIELGEIEGILGQHPAIKECVVIIREDIPGKKQLVAYVVAPQAIKIKQLRTFLGQKLPNYMIPAVWVELEELPLTPNGKVDRRALPIPDSPLTTETAYSEAITPIEKQLVRIWQEVLAIERVGIHDNFFELGGDSIISLQIISQAHQVEIYLTPKQLFQYPTIAQLATVASSKNIATAEQGLVTGTFPLIPIQSWFFESNFANPHHYNQAVMLNVPSDIDGVMLQKAIAKLISHHDLLRTKFEQIETQWQPCIVAESHSEYFTQLDFEPLPQDKIKSTIEATAEDIQASLNLSTGQILRAVLLNLNSNSSNRLLIAIHHLVVDGVSWRILLEDLQNIYNSLKNNQIPQLPAKTTSFSEWANRLVSYASSEELTSELNYWLTTLKQTVTPLPLDYPQGENSEASTIAISVALNPEETQILLQEVPATYKTQINDVLLTALVQTFTQWMGGNTLLFDLEGHGREDLFEDVDISRTVGWFTSVFPVLLNLKGIEHLGEALKTIKEQLRAIPNRGIGYGILRYLSQKADIIESLSSLPQAEIGFNYLGQFEGVLTDSSAFTSASESSGTEQSKINHCSYVLEIDSMIIDGCLQLNWTYSRNLHRKSTIEFLAQSYLTNLRSLIFHCQSPDAGGFTPSDFVEFKQSKWNNDDLAAITAAIQGGV